MFEIMNVILIILRVKNNETQFILSNYKTFEIKLGIF